jgi:hypothetical protein
MTEPQSWRCTNCDTYNTVGRDRVCHCCGSEPRPYTPVQQATAAAVEASRQSDTYALMLAAVQAVQQQAPHQCQHPAPARASAGTGKWIAIALAGSVGAISLALSAIAVAVGAVAATCSLIVLRSMWQSSQKGRG